METKPKKISVVIPVHDPNLPYLENALNSVINQNMEDLEIIISDDSEESSEALKTLISNKARVGANIKYVRHIKQPGIFLNLNNAIKNASGEYIQLLCQDDELKTGSLQEHLRILNENPEVGVVFSQFDAITEDGRKVKLESKYDFRFQFPDYLNKEDMSYVLLVFGCLPGNLSPVMLRKETIEQVGYFNPDRSYAGDFDYWARAAQRVDFYFNKKSLIYVRRHEHQASRKIPYVELVKDRAAVYTELLANQKHKINNGKMVWYLNQLVGAQHFHLFIRELMSDKMIWKQLKVRISLLNQGPFSVFKSAFMYLITLNGRIPYIKYPISGR